MTYRTPKVNGDGAFKGDLHPLGVRIDASGGWWDAGDYLKFVHATSYTVRPAAHRRPRLPRSDGRRFGHVRLHRGGEVRRRWLLRMWDDETQTLYYQVGIGYGNDRTAGDHDIWRLPQDDDTYGGHGPASTDTSATGRCSGPARPGRRSARTSPGATPRRFALCFQVFRDSDPTFANECLIAAEHIFDLADTTPTGNLIDGDPVRLLPRDGVARRPGARRHRAVLRAREGEPAGRSATRGADVLPARRPPTGRTSTSPVRTTPRTR